MRFVILGWLGLRNEVTLCGSRLFYVSVLDRNEDSSVSLVQSLRNGVTLFGSSLRCVLPHSIGTKSLSEPYSKFLRDEVTLWVELCTTGSLLKEYLG